MTSKHTAGPWFLWGHAEASLVISGPECFVAQTLGGNDKANARLIAAAPELLEALIWADHVLRFNEVIEEAGAGSPGSLASKMRAAIARATGESE